MSSTLHTFELHGIRNHIALYLEPEGQQHGVKYHVMGTVLRGMIYQRKEIARPLDDVEYVPESLTSIGKVDASDIPRLEEICLKVPPPAKQMNTNGTQIDPSKPVRRCGEWVTEVITELREQDILKD